MARDGGIEIPGGSDTTLGKLKEEKLTRASDILEKAKIKFVCFNTSCR
jgi:hypothetical protein